MPRVTTRPNEPFEKTMRRFKKAVDRADILQDLRDREFHEKPSLKRKKTRAAAIKRTQKEMRENQLPNRNRKY